MFPHSLHHRLRQRRSARLRLPRTRIFFPLGNSSVYAADAESARINVHQCAKSERTYSNHHLIDTLRVSRSNAAARHSALAGTTMACHSAAGPTALARCTRASAVQAHSYGGSVSGDWRT